MSENRIAFALVSILVFSVFLTGIIPSTISAPLDVKGMEKSDELSLEQEIALSRLHSSSQSSGKTIDTNGVTQLGWAEMNYLSEITTGHWTEVPLGIREITVDMNGNALITGWFNRNVTLGNFSISPSYSSGGNGYSPYNNTDLFVAKLNPQGIFLWVTTAYASATLYASQGNQLDPSSIQTDSSGNAYVAVENDVNDVGVTVTFGNHSFTGWTPIFLAKISADGYWMWMTGVVDSDPSHCSTYDFKVYEIALDSYQNMYVSGIAEGCYSDFGNNIILSGNSTVPYFLAKISANGSWQWARSGLEWGSGLGRNDASTKDGLHIAIGTDDSIYATGFFRGSEVEFGNITVTGIPHQGGNEAYRKDDGYVAKLNSTDGEWIWVTPFGIGGWGVNDQGRDITIDGNNDIYITYWTQRGGYLYTGNDSSWGGWQSWGNIPHNGSNFGIAKIGSDGLFLWVKQSIGGTIESTSDGRILTFGYCGSCGSHYSVNSGWPETVTVSFDGINITFPQQTPTWNHFILAEVNADNGSLLWGIVGLGITDWDSKIAVSDSARVLISSEFVRQTSSSQEPLLGIHRPCSNIPSSLGCRGTLLVTLRPDLDGDGLANSLDSDDDGDRLSDSEEIYLGLDPLHPDSDEDGSCDYDIGVSILGVEICDAGPDPFPLDANEWLDTDLDGVGNNADSDDDGDGLSDVEEQTANPATDHLLFDTDGDGTCDGPINVQYNLYGVLVPQGGVQISNISELNVEGINISIESESYSAEIISDFMAPTIHTFSPGWMEYYLENYPDYMANKYVLGDAYILSRYGNISLYFGPECSAGPDAFPLDQFEWYDTDNDGIGNNADYDDDGDGWRDDKEEDYCNENNDPLDDTDMPTDTDGDWVCNWQDWDDDGDEISDSWDLSPLDPCIGFDTDGDGLSDRLGNITLSGDECDSSAYEIDQDDDGDAWSDEDESVCDTDSLDNTSVPADLDGDHICDIVDTDDDDDGVADESDIWPRDSCAAFDTDSDGIPDTVIDGCQTNLTADDDDDGDSVLDVDDFCSPGETGWISGATLGTDHDGDGCRDDGEDTDDDNDGVNDSEDGCPRGITGAAFNAIFDTDGDGCLESEDSDDDNDGVSDINDDFPLDPSETTDTDGDGIGDNADTDDDGDGWSDHEETYECDTNPLDENSIPTDTDYDLECDKSDTDDDNDGLLDIEELLIGTDPLSEDSDSDGVRDSEDIFPLDSTEWVDTDGDGTGDNSDAFPSIARYQTYGGIALELSAVLIIVIIALLVLRMRGGGESEEDSPEPNNTDPMEDYVQQLIAQGYPEEAARQYAEHFQK